MLQINTALWNKYEYGVVSGACGAVGVAGLAMGGGVGYITRKHGLLVDNIVSVKIVTANGRLLIANANRNSDLFWAIRGAGAAGFGVVTQFTLKTFPASGIFVWAKLNYSVNGLSLVMRNWQKILQLPNCDTIGFNINRQPFSISPEIFLFTFVITEPSMSNIQLDILKGYLPNVTDNEIKRGTYLEMLQDTNDVWPKCSAFLRHRNWIVKKYLTDEEVQFFSNLIVKRDYAGFGLEPCPSRESQPTRTDTAYVHRDCLFIMRVRYYIHACDPDTVANATMLDEEYYKGLKEVARLLSFSDSGESYQNYENDDLLDWQQRLYAENYKRLQMIKRKFDATNFFRFNHSISLI
ncbi:oxidoreductase-like protein [Leptotrombidium deliense]|uniref:Oxidoreductase-like protein n=1 Tax=Leptotrombidium deliense TaxID=299467 RepID=A0A443SG42_9ACAR|nr:oxidoreductase-like protein [Leptotrombidium deliense]